MAPKHIVLEEAGPRDGFRNIPEFIPAEFKIEKEIIADIRLIFQMHILHN